MKVSARKRRNLKMAVRMGRIHEASMKAPPKKRKGNAPRGSAPSPHQSRLNESPSKKGREILIGL